VPEVAGASWNDVVARGARVRVLCPRFDEIKRSAHSFPDPINRKKSRPQRNLETLGLATTNVCKR
jgi:hypothetical protein